MSDKEADDDVGLPKATVFKLITEMLPPDMSCSKEAKEIIVECCVEWVKLISTQANTVCEESTKKTISPEHVTEALKQLGFEGFIEEVEESNKAFKQSQKERQRSAPDTNGMSQEELLALQERLFASSQARFEAGQ
ncbi:histone-fold-containing protein [Kockovaella imperatae]|uniref:Histone-fold-containing protein n=1 Tax=Kockovaella imperatae TaxID=4999 RepID=A0A1Y1UPU3_9TREE|nr:histone-fold-containing protein [Kockovaella imperatae]ORX40078.1 histone-fold-containing protein [Kockovaella imperatae]